MLQGQMAAWFFDHDNIPRPRRKMLMFTSEMQEYVPARQLDKYIFCRADRADELTRKGYYCPELI
jgi:hypothetical protein